jgi:hypothetical protein
MHRLEIQEFPKQHRFQRTITSPLSHDCSEDVLTAWTTKYGDEGKQTYDTFPEGTRKDTSNLYSYRWYDTIKAYSNSMPMQVWKILDKFPYYFNIIYDRE